MDFLREQDDWHMRSLQRRMEWLQDKKIELRMAHHEDNRIDVDIDWLEQLLMENMGLHQSMRYYRDMTAQAYKGMSIPTQFIKQQQKGEEK